MKPDKSILVAYYSLTGNTERVAQDIAARLNAELERISDKKNRSGFWGYLRAAFDSMRESPAEIADIRKDPGNYALIVVGTPVWAGKMTPAVRAYLRMTRGALNEVAFFTTSGDTDPGRIVPIMETLAGRKAIASAGLNARDLKSGALGEGKISAFVGSIQRSRSGLGSVADSSARAHSQGD
jgi:hypothetical protein